MGTLQQAMSTMQDLGARLDEVAASQMRTDNRLEMVVRCLSDAMKKENQDKVFNDNLMRSIWEVRGVSGDNPSVSAGDKATVTSISANSSPGTQRKTVRRATSPAK